MALLAGTVARGAVRASLAPTRFERVLGVGALAFLLVVLVALARGHAVWAQVPALVWGHLLLLMLALALTPVLMLQARGTRRHRRLGWLWVVAMVGAAILSLGLRSLTGGWSPIRALSVLTILAVPALAWTARARRVANHRRLARNLVAGALLLAGVFTLVGERTLARMMWG